MGQTPGRGQRGLSGWLLLEVQGERAPGPWLAEILLQEWGPLKVLGLEMAQHPRRAWGPECGRLGP